MKRRHIVETYTARAIIKVVNHPPRLRKTVRFVDGKIRPGLKSDALTKQGRRFAILCRIYTGYEWTGRK